MNLFDTLTGQTKTLNKQKINIYACGPTIYDYIHIGNARPILLMDTLIRFLESQDKEVVFLQNVTDVDDKIIQKALEHQTSEKKISEKYYQAYLKNLKDLNIRQPNQLVLISDKIDTMNLFIDKLVNNKSAYVVDGDVYFDIGKYQSEYGALSNKKINDLFSGTRHEIDLKKKFSLDFSIWKKTNKGIQWNSKYGVGRPGWHTECAVLIDEYFSHQTIDIHAGGIDLQFPHHENERIQFLANNNKELANIWVHNGHLTVDNAKMSKSLKNVTTLEEFLIEKGPNILRWIFLSTYYKQPINISEDIVNQAEKFMLKLQNVFKKVRQIKIEKGRINFAEISHSIIEEFNQAMNADLNTPQVLTLIEELVKQINKADLPFVEILQKANSLKYILQVLGFSNDMNFEVKQSTAKIYLEWKECIKTKEFEKADHLRKKLVKEGLI